MALERTIVKLPAGFDPDKHAAALPEFVSKQRGPGWELESISMQEGTAILTRRAAVMEVQNDTSTGALQVNLPTSVKATDGDKWAAKYAELHPGYHLVKFEPHVGRAVLAQMSEPELRCRFAVAGALSVKPWDVMVSSRRDGGFALQLPHQYVPSKHDAKLQEVAESVMGSFGWYVKVDAKTLVAQIIPSEPPTFDAVIELPLKHLGAGTLDRTPFGLKLPEPGKVASEVAHLDWVMSPYLLLGGLPRSGKSVTLRDIIADLLSNGSELVVVDTPDKAIDFRWCKPFVRDGGWGCSGLRESVTALKLAHEEFKRRADVLKEKGVENWYRLPPGERFAPITIVVDEVSMLLMTDRLPAGVDRKSPEVQAILQRNLMKFRLQKMIYDIMAEMGFVGARVILSSQVTNASTGLPPTMKALIGNKGLQGSNPSKAQRDQAFNVSAKVPEVPINLQAGGMAAKGVGAAEFEGQEPFIYKPYFADEDKIVEVLTRLGVPTTDRPEPTVAEMDRLCPLDEEDLDEEPESLEFGAERLPSGKPVSTLDPKFGPAPTSYDDNGRPLRGAAAAAHASKQISDAVASRPLCPSCDQPIQPNGDCGCSY